MTSRAPMTPRRVSAEEIAVLRAALSRAPAIPDAARFLYTLENLVVVRRCDCGCDTVEFRRSDPKGTPGVVADGVGETGDGATVNVIVFAADHELASLEVCGVTAETARLPDPRTVRPWEEYRLE